MAKTADLETLNIVKTILDTETWEQSQYRLVTDMIRGSLSFDRHFEEVLLQVEKLRKGIDEAGNK